MEDFANLIGLPQGLHSTMTLWLQEKWPLDKVLIGFMKDVITHPEG